MVSNVLVQKKMWPNKHRTHETGKLIVLKEYEKAFWSILKADRKDPEKNAVIDLFENDFDFAKALNKLEFKHSIERTLVDGLRKAGKGNFLGAMMNLTKTLRNLYIHAYQSFLWNRALSQRMALYGKTLVTGDYVTSGDSYVVVTKGNVSQFSFNDVYLPIVGRDTALEENSITAEIYRVIMTEEDVGFEDFRNHPSRYFY